MFLFNCAWARAQLYLLFGGARKRWTATSGNSTLVSFELNVINILLKWNVLEFVVQMLTASRRYYEMFFFIYIFRLENASRANCVSGVASSCVFDSRSALVCPSLPWVQFSCKIIFFSLLSVYVEENNLLQRTKNTSKFITVTVIVAV